MIRKPRGFSVLSACGTLLALAALGGGLAACGGSSATTTLTKTSAPAGSPATAGTTTTAASSGAATTASVSTKSGGVASPGTKLSVGQTAKVAYTPVGSGAGPSTLLVTVKSFQKGSLSDFNGIQLDASQKAGTPYYVKVHVQNLGPHTIDVDGTAAAIEGVDNTGNNQQSVTFIGSFPPCNDMASTTPLGAGHSYDDCLTFLVPGGITKVSYNGTTDYIDSPVTWAPGS
jgi:hypothetical protein